MLQTSTQSHPFTADAALLKTRGMLSISVGLSLLAVLAIPVIDVAVTRLFRIHELPGDLHTLVSLAEVFAHSYGVIFILLTAYVLDPSNRRRLLQVAVLAFSSGIVSLLIKVAVGRIRPNQLSLDTLGVPGGSLDTFIGLFPVSTRWSAISDYAVQSFPSAHTATAVGLALGLARLYPAGRWLFGLFAVLAAVQRISVGAHFVSDTLIGAAVAFSVCGCLVHKGLLCAAQDDPAPQLPLRRTA